MIKQSELVESVSRLSESIVVIAEALIKERINTEIDFENDSVVEFLTPYQRLAMIDVITKQFYLNQQDFVNLGAIHLPIKYLSCYVLLNARAPKIEQGRK